MNFKAAIFDLDGTVLRNEHAYAKAFSEVLKDSGAVDIPKHPQTGGIGVRNNWKNFISKYNLNKDLSIDLLSKMTQQIYLKNLTDVHVREGLHELIFDLKNNHVKTALATSNSKDAVDKVLNHFSIIDLFNIVLTLDDVKSSKPDPEIFKKSADSLGISYGECIVFEDARSGVQAAKMINMKVIGIGNSTDPELSDADIVRENFIDLNFEKLKLMLE